MLFIQAMKISKRYGRGDAAVCAIREMDFGIDQGAFIAIMGESGAGKSTLLGILGAMNPPTTGRLMVEGMDVFALPGERRADFRREFLGFVFQSFHLLPYLTVYENAMLPLVSIRKRKTEKARMVEEALHLVGLEARRDRLPSQISGGEQERAAIARAIVNDPPILLADEPTGNLDSRTSMEIMALFKKLHAKGTTIVMVTHNPICAGFAQQVFRISDGRLENSPAVVPEGSQAANASG